MSNFIVAKLNLNWITLTRQIQGITRKLIHLVSIKFEFQYCKAV